LPWLGWEILGLGFAFAVILLIAHERLKVEVDPKIEQIHTPRVNWLCFSARSAFPAPKHKKLVE